MENNNIANYVNIFACVRFKSLRSISLCIIQMLQVYGSGALALRYHVQNMSNASELR